MADYFAHDSAWIADDGSYGAGLVIHFSPDALTEDQWDVLDNLNDGAKFDYVYAVLNNQDLSKWEDE
jgi:hypothetical protein